MMRKSLRILNDFHVLFSGIDNASFEKELVSPDDIEEIDAYLALENGLNSLVDLKSNFGETRSVHVPIEKYTREERWERIRMWQRKKLIQALRGTKQVK